MFFYSEGPENDKGYTIWFDEVQFEKLGTIAYPRPAILNGQDQTTIAAVGHTLNIGDIYILFNMPNGTDERINVSPSYFTFTSSDESIATVNENGQITVIAMGTAKVTAKFGSIDATGSITINVEELPDPAPVPTVPAANVISLFSNAYTNVPVDTWATGWLYSTAVLTELQINGDDVKLYTNLNFNGIEFASQTIDVTQMTHFHMDIWTPNSTTPPAAFKVLLVDFGANGVFGGVDDVSHEVTFAGLCAMKMRTTTITGNVFRRCGKDSSQLAEGERSCQVRLEECSGLTFVSNVCAAGRDDGGKGNYTPQVGFILRKLSHSVISSNTLFRGYMQEMTMDLGEHGADYVFANNVACPMSSVG